MVVQVGGGFDAVAPRGGGGVVVDLKKKPGGIMATMNT